MNLRPRPPRAAPVLLLLLGLLAACTSRSGPLEKTSGDSVTVEVNSKAPAFAAPSMDGKTVRLADYVGSHVVLLEFWSVFCKSCLEEMPHIEALHAKYAKDGLAVISVNTDVFSKKRVASFLEKKGIRPPYPIVRDQRQEVVNAFKVELLPVTVIIDRDGWIRLYQEGYRPGDEKGFEKTVRKLLGREMSEDVTLASRQGVTVFAPVRATAAPEKDERFEELAGQTLAGQPVDLLANKGSLLFFWSLFCKPCREEFPDMERLAAQYGPKGIAVYSVNVDTVGLHPRVQRFAGEHPALPCLADPPEPGGLAERLGVRVTPTHVLVDGKGAVVCTTSGSSDLSKIEAALKTAAP